jgi:hypothetical protein
VVRITSRTKTSTTTRIAASSILRRPVRVIEVLPNGVCGGAVQFDGWFDVDQNLTTAFDVGYAMGRPARRKIGIAAYCCVPVSPSSASLSPMFTLT